MIQTFDVIYLMVGILLMVPLLVYIVGVLGKNKRQFTGGFMVWLTAPFAYFKLYQDSKKEIKLTPLVLYFVVLLIALLVTFGII